MQDPTVKATFDKWANEAPGSTGATDSMYSIEKVMVDDVVAIPQCATAPQGVYNTTKFTGWPTKSDPYGLPGVISDDAIVMMLHVPPKASAA